MPGKDLQKVIQKSQEEVKEIITLQKLLIIAALLIAYLELYLFDSQ
ncbi:hypothetical protein [Legionella qingyii]|nr:hypothetical protein [Legionella qingyii]